jgi:hypothetical protein
MTYRELVDLHYADTDNPKLSRDQRKELVTEFFKEVLKSYGRWPGLDVALNRFIERPSYVYPLLRDKATLDDIGRALGKKLTYYSGEQQTSGNPSRGRHFGKVGGSGAYSKWIKPSLHMEDLTESFLSLFESSPVKSLIGIVSKFQKENPYPDCGELYWNAETHSAIYNVGDGQEGSLRELKDAMSKVSGVEGAEVADECGRPDGFKLVWSQHS